MTAKLTVYVDESLKRLIKETSGNRKMSDVVSDALESYLTAGLIKEPNLSDKKKTSAPELPSLSEVRSRRPKAPGSSAEIIASQRRGRDARLS
jgi:hypothetical protein